jgi:hypothetical protein
VALQRWTATMEYYVGLGVSLKQTSICVVDQVGSVVREGVVDSDPEATSVYVTSKAPNAVLASRRDRRLRGYGPSLSSLACR